MDLILLYGEHQTLHFDCPVPSSPLQREREAGKLCKANSILSAVPGTMGKVSFVALTALAGGWGEPGWRTMCEKLRLWVSHTAQYVSPHPPLGQADLQQPSPQLILA